MRKLFFISFYLIFASSLWAQKDTFQLQEVVAKSVLRDNFNVGASTTNLDSSILSEYQNNNLGDVLSAETGVFIKSYGLGSLSTSSVRGAGASHTKVLWNGFDISNPMLGQVDFSYINVIQFDNISVQQGNTTGLYGGGTQGGVINLNNYQTFEEVDELSLNLGIGSFSNFSKNLNYKSSTKRWITSVSVNTSEAQNDFKYQEFKSEKRRENSQVESYGIKLSNSFKLNNYSNLSFENWFQNNERGMPSAIGVSNKNESLQNQFLRNTLTYSYYGTKIDFKIRGAYFNEELNYRNPTSNLISNSSFERWIGEIESKYRINSSNEFFIGFNSTNDIAHTQNYLGNPSRNSFAVFGAYKSEILKDKLKLSQSFRQEVVSGFAIPLTGSFGVDYKLNDIISLLGSASRNYRIPTFNDLYYANFGNPNLNPEKGWGAESSVQFNDKYGWVKGTYFYNDYVNWINWQPQFDGNWRPQNNDVQTSGIEFSMNQKVEFISFRFNYSYTNSFDLETQKQMIYVPKNKLNYSFGTNYKKWNLFVNHSILGERYITTDNKNSITGFDIVNFSIGREISVENEMVDFNFRTNNILNKQYQAIVNQPMPGRYYEFNIGIKFKNNKNDKKVH